MKKIERKQPEPMTRFCRLSSLLLLSVLLIIFATIGSALSAEADKEANDDYILEDTIYGIASVTKSLICLGILILEEQGKLKVTDPASRYIPLKLGLKDDPITIHHLMSHTSGIPEIIGQLHEHLYRQGFRDDHYSSENTEQVPLIPMTGWDDFFRHINQAGEYVIEKPGQRLYYQNDCFAMLGRIIEMVSGQALQEFMKEAVLGPLEMNESTFMQADIDKLDNMAVPYEYIETQKKLLACNWNVENAELFYAAGGLFSSVTQMANYIMMHLNKGQFKGRQMVTAENIGGKEPIQFEMADNGDVWLHYERWKFKKARA